MISVSTRDLVISVSRAATKHAYSYQTPAAQGSRVAPQTASGNTLKTPREQDGQVERASGERSLPMVLRAHGKYQDTLLYCLNAYRVASGQHPDEIQHTLCKICGNPSEEMDHRLAFEVARALGPAAMLRAFTLENLRWLCRSCHRRKTRQDWRLAKFLASCVLDWHGAQQILRQHRRWALSFMLRCSLEPAPRQRQSIPG